MAIIITKNGKEAKKIDKSDFEKENYLQNLIHENPESIPVYEISEDKKLFVVAREFSTGSGPIDALAIDQDGDIYVVETKLYKNPDKRTVVAQALDYGASLWKHTNDFDEFINIIDKEVQGKFGMSFQEKAKTFFVIDEEQTNLMLENMRFNLKDGNIKFVILMDSMDERLKDLIIYVNQNSQFDIYAVQLEYYKFEQYEIMIPKIFGVEVKKNVKGSSSTRQPGIKWNWDLLKKRLLEDYGQEEVNAAQKIINWLEENNIENSWSTSQRGGFIPVLYTKDKKAFFCPFSVAGNAKIIWNAPHQGDKSPFPFDDPEKRLEILKRLQSVKGANVDLNNVNGYNGFKMPLGVIEKENSFKEFFDVFLWIKKTLETGK
jgi:hypothetical protein